MKTHNSDADPKEINWELVVKNWDLPLKVSMTNTNPHLPELCRYRLRTESPGPRNLVTKRLPKKVMIFPPKKSKFIIAILIGRNDSPFFPISQVMLLSKVVNDYPCNFNRLS